LLLSSTHTQLIWRKFKIRVVVYVRSIVNKMNRKKSETDKTERKLIIKWREEGKSINEIAKLIDRSKSTIHYILKKFNDEKDITNKPRPGRPKKLTEREEKTVIREIQRDPFISGPKLASIVATQFKKKVHPELCRRLMRKNGFRVAPTTKSRISKTNKILRLKNVKEYINKDSSYCSTVLFSKEGKLKIFGSDTCNTIWKKKTILQQ
jgi:transposase